MQEFFQQVVNGVVLGTAYAIFAAGFGVVIANLRVFNMAHPAVFTWAGVAFYYLATDLHANVAVCLVGAILAGAALEITLYGTVFRQLQEREDRDFAGFIASIGLSLSLVALADIVLNHTTVAIPPYSISQETVNWIGMSTSGAQILMVGLSLVGAVAAWFITQRSRWALSIRASAYDRQESASLGVAVGRISVLVFGLAGALAGLGAGLVLLSFSSINSNFGLNYLIVGITIIVLAGFNNIATMAWVGVVVGVASSLIDAYVSYGFGDVILFGLLFIVLVLRSFGLGGRTSGGLRWDRAGSERA